MQCVESRERPIISLKYQESYTHKWLEQRIHIVSRLLRRGTFRSKTKPKKLVAKVARVAFVRAENFKNQKQRHKLEEKKTSKIAREKRKFLREFSS